MAAEVGESFCVATKVGISLQKGIFIVMEVEYLKNSLCKVRFDFFRTSCFSIFFFLNDKVTITLRQF